MELVRFAVSAPAAVSSQLAFDRVVPRDDSTLFTGYLVLPAVAGVRGATGPWNVVGQERTVLLSDGGSFRERITRYDRPDEPDGEGRFDYAVDRFTGILSLVVSDAVASWRYRPGTGAGGSTAAGSVIEWSYGYRPLPGRRFLVRRVIGPLWMRYMRRSIAVCARVAETG
ncbi:SRPBCC family protein [Herbiconiux sp. KACC 21604]|uniref:SRPBCC family protein n=1 Tax=unclassified Herbiconiux TaxID=2618217 RepID=UPI0014930EEA|nr:SRPBCC family protein [Herbiconiux sp. SALV-R1]QJU53853.1 hypothetical protein HL652_09555 [Herbiconiux sp. SALV-R1]WPO84865.1 SRPBCC family protein [Herbiconiux sp. KACC 21604]